MKKVLFLGSMVLLSAPASADVAADLQKQAGTLFVKSSPSFSDGKLAACGFEFSVLLQDWAYRQGSFILVGGSFSIFTAKGTLSQSLKVVLHDIDLKTAKFSPSPPETAYFVFSDFSTNKASLVGSYPSDTPGALFSVFQILPAYANLASDIEKGKVQIAFARRKGGQDLKIEVDLTVSDTSTEGKRERSRAAIEEYDNCAQALISQLKVK